MTPEQWQYVVYGVIVVLWVGLLALTRLYLKSFFARVFISLTPIVIGVAIVTFAWVQYSQGKGGFRLGTDLVGGTILVYEIDEARSAKALANDQNLANELAVRLKKRLDPNDLKNVIVRPVSNGHRVEVILPTGGAHQAEIEERNWLTLIDEVRQQWPELKDTNINVAQGRDAELIRFIADHTNAKTDQQIQDIRSFVAGHYNPQTNYTENQIQDVKDRISQVGSMEFAVVANDHDDRSAIDAAKAFVSAEHQDDLIRAARDGLAPPQPVNPEGGDNPLVFLTDKGSYTYSWIELGPEERTEMEINNERWDRASNKWVSRDLKTEKGTPWAEANSDRPEWGKTFTLTRWMPGALLYARSANLNTRLTERERAERKVEYFVLIRNTPQEYIVNGDMLVNPSAGTDQQGNPIVLFHFDAQGGRNFYWLTTHNLPDDAENPSSFHRLLAIVLDGRVISAPRVNGPISDSGQIEGKFSPQQVAQLVANLKAGALPATLKPQPVSENTMGATLGQTTVHKGIISIGVAFGAVLIFMVIYYEFAGFVACVALLANLLLTIGFMVMVSAAFTLPGLAGLVLMLGMAVDANVLIYERIREERDRGASLALSIRNGYDRAFPTIIDTHLTSIFTAIVLYAVGNDQLKGFGVSLTVGLIISLFTSLYMTRLMFDIWFNRGWIRKLSMRRLLSRPNINFMAIRYQWFTATVILTIFGISVFLLRGSSSLNIDFIGGTAYGGRLVKPMPLDGTSDDPGLRNLLAEARQKELLQVAQVEEVPTHPGYQYTITYKDPDGSTAAPRTIDFAQEVLGQTPAERGTVVAQRAAVLPDWSVELLFPESYITGGDKSNYFTVRTSEKSPDLVQAQLGRLLTDKGHDLLESVYMNAPTVKSTDDGTATLMDATFRQSSAPDSKAATAATGQVERLLKRELEREGLTKTQVDVTGVGQPTEGRYGHIEAKLGLPADVARVKEYLAQIEKDPAHKLIEAKAGQALPTEAKLANAVAAMQNEFSKRPVPDRLETFDQVLAGETQLKALYAILLSWAAILLYLWFRFGSWTFGLAAVLCLMHDLFFTLGIIAFCHYISVFTPAIAHALAIEDFKIDLNTVAALLTLVGYSVSDTIVVFDRIREVRGKNPELTPQMINDSVNQTLSRTLLTAFATWLVVAVLYVFGGEGVHLFSFVMVVGVIVGTYSSIYIASPLLLIFGEGTRKTRLPGSTYSVPAAGGARV